MADGTDNVGVCLVTLEALTWTAEADAANNSWSTEWRCWTERLCMQILQRARNFMHTRLSDQWCLQVSDQQVHREQTAQATAPSYNCDVDCIDKQQSSVDDSLLSVGKPRLG